jgi:hypothetical protein
MQRLNTMPIEDFLDKARVARKTNQKTVTLSLKECNDLADSLALVMTRLSGDLDQALAIAPTQSAAIEVKMDGGNF